MGKANGFTQFDLGGLSARQPRYLPREGSVAQRSMAPPIKLGFRGRLVHYPAGGVVSSPVLRRPTTSWFGIRRRGAGPQGTQWMRHAPEPSRSNRRPASSFARIEQTYLITSIPQGGFTPCTVFDTIPPNDIRLWGPADGQVAAQLGPAR